MSEFRMSWVLRQILAVVRSSIGSLTAIALLHAAGFFCFRQGVGAVLPGTSVDWAVVFELRLEPSILGNAAMLLLWSAISVVFQVAVTFLVLRTLRGGALRPGPALVLGCRFFLPALGVVLVAGLGAGLAAILLIVPGIMLSLRWLVALQARVAEPLSLRAALRRSSDITNGARWSLAGLTVLYVAAGWSVETLARRVAEGLDLVAPPVLATALDCGFTAACNTLFSVGLAVCYARLRALYDAAPGRPVEAEALRFASP